MDEFEPEETEASPPPPKPSKTPSWVMLGFVLGALAMLAVPRGEKKIFPPQIAMSAPAFVPPAPPPAKPTAEGEMFFEEIFAELQQSAVWQDDLTEVAFWNTGRKAFSDYYEVLRVGDKFYFRS